ncbi:hypothetical protein [Aurantibacter sp.]|uniref:hypothetical protein n=1 Tax=Aurantibacter sp. TaxID=2807103 RepID=UPI0032660397
MKNILIVLITLFSANVWAQDSKIKVITEEIPNRLAFYAVNENEEDLDVMITIEGTNFRQSKARPRLIRVPGISKVHLKTIMLLRGKTPQYTYDLVVNDSLSKRAVKKEATAIKIKPKKNITVYVPSMCNQCDSLLQSLADGKYLYQMHKLDENVEMKNQLNRSFANTMQLDSLETPIINLGGKLFTKINNYDDLITKLEFED